jgi:multiple sugar transport system permease protein
VNAVELRRRIWKSLPGWGFVSLAIFGVIAFSLGPMIVSFGYTFTEYDILSPPRFIGIENYRKLMEDELFSKSLVNTLYYTGVSLPLRLLIALVLAMLLNMQLRGISFFRTLYYLPSITAGVAVALLWQWAFEPRYGFVNYLLALVGIKGPTWLGSVKWAMPALILMSLWSIGQPMLIFLAGLQGIPRELYEVADLDGATPFEKFRYVTFPQLTPVVFFNVVTGVIGSFQVFTQVYVMTGGGPLRATTVYVMYLYQQAFQWLHMGYGATLAWVLFLMILVCTLIQFKLSSWVHYEGGAN